MNSILKKISMEYFVLLAVMFLTVGYALDQKFLYNTAFFVGLFCKIIYLYKNKLEIRFNDFNFKLLLLMILFCFSLLFISFYAVDINESMKFAEYYFKWMFIPFFMISFLSIGIKDFYKYMLYGLIIGSIVIASGVFWNSFALGMDRPGGFFITAPNSVAGRLIFCLPFIILNKNLKNFYLKCLVSFFIFAAVVLTGSRGGIIAGIIEIVILIWYLRKYNKVKICENLKRKQVITFLLLICITSITVGSVINSRFIEFIKYNGNYIEHRVGGDRILLWKSSIDMIKDNPITGVGLRNFNKVYIENGYIEKEAKEPNLISPHNIFLHIFVEAGLIGFVNFMILLLYQLYSGYKYSNDNLILAYFLAIIGMCVHGMVDYLIWTKNYYLFYWFMVGCIYAYKTNELYGRRK